MPRYRMNETTATTASCKQLSQTSAYTSTNTLPRSAAHSNFVEKVLSEFDRIHSHDLEIERKVLSGEVVTTGNTSLPSSYMREVIRVSLADLNLLAVVRGIVEPSATASMQIPYEERNLNVESLENWGVVYEGQPIPVSGVTVAAENAYMQPMKLAFKITNEALHFTRSANMDWEAFAGNIIANSRIFKELLQLRIAGEMLRASDAFQSVAIENEAVEVDSNGRIKTAQFPVVRPFISRTLNGATVGNPLNPVQLTLAGANVPFFTGKKDLPAGLYWKFENLNLGYLQIVDAKGTPAGEGATGTLSYSYATNLKKFDMAVPAGVPLAKHLNGLLEVAGDQIAVLKSQRFSAPDFMLMSAMVNNDASKAEQFVTSLKRNGSDTDSAGDLLMIKGTEAYDTGLSGDMQDNRIVLGQRGVTAYGIAKPFEMGQPFQASQGGLATGELISYGEEYSVIHTPKPVYGRYSSVLLYDSSTR